MERRCLKCNFIFETNNDNDFNCPLCGSQKTEKNFWFITEIQLDVQRVEYILSTDIFSKEQRNNPLVKSALIEVLICLRDLVKKIGILSATRPIEEIQFTDDVIIPSELLIIDNKNKYPNDIRGLIILVRNALCHLEFKGNYIVPDKYRLSYIALYDNSSPVPNITSEYEDDVCFCFGNLKIYLNHHIIRYFNEAKQRLSSVMYLNPPIPSLN